MATARVIYFSGEQEVKNVHGIRNAEFAAQFPGVKGRRYDGYAMFVGHPLTGPDEILPVTRTIFYKKNPSLHKCDARCRHAKGGNCECSCGGKFHGVGSAA